MSNFISNSIDHASDYITSGITKRIPKMSVDNKKILNSVEWVGKNLTAPHTNRLIMGVTALATQPFIDLHNKKVDEDTRKTSAARTLAKVIVGTSTGVAIRYACIKAIEYCTKLPKEISENTKFPKLKQLFTPQGKLTITIRNLNQYKKALGTFLGLGVMLFTNFLLDAPLTKLLTNKFIDKIHKEEEMKKKKEVVNA